MDELKDFMDIRIVTRCPMCGKRFKRLTIEFNENTPIWIHGRCDCGLATILDSKNGEKDILDEWNKVVSK